MQRLTRAARLLASLAYRRFWLGPQGRCKPVSRQVWEEQYQTGKWDYLGSLPELARYMVIVGYVKSLPSPPCILDLGCGEGRLLTLMCTTDFASYVGVDFSESAILRAGKHASARAAFVVSDFETFNPAGKTDVLVLNESLYNSPKPLHLLDRYSACLNPNGRIIVSMFDSPGHESLWRKMNARLHRLDGVCIQHDSQTIWRVAMYASRSLPGPTR